MLFLNLTIFSMNCSGSFISSVYVGEQLQVSMDRTDGVTVETRDAEHELPDSALEQDTT